MKKHFIQKLIICGILFAMADTAFAQTKQAAPAAAPAQPAQTKQAAPAAAPAQPAQTKQAAPAAAPAQPTQTKQAAPAAAPAQPAQTKQAAPAAAPAQPAQTKQAAPAAAPAQPAQTKQAAPAAAPAQPAQTKQAAPAAAPAQPAQTKQAAPAAAPAQPAQTKQATMAEAQKAYVAGKWKEAATAYEQVCKTQPEEKRPECYLWNILALSQTGNAADFTKAGKRLDSLIQVVNPQKAIYADLMMTRAQFLLYLGKFENSADALVHAIETSKPEQNAVLQKVCTAIQAKITKENLTDACNRLKNDPQNLANVSEQKNQTAPQDLELPDFDAPSPSAKPQATQPKAAESELWALQMGAFSMKANAETLCNNLQKRKILCNIAELNQDSRTLYLVQTPTFKTREEAVNYGTKTLTPINIDFRPVLKK